ncbi:unnamed protein product [Pleuronectes platessa]|uniref:Uncharacterized protein n=1 Tax=Pleuronectes platessa TaxID=8262 RepID=A0A9N7ZC33_PLEPL|nr:unnamed protein product [Pleuronectes platessa]
MSPSSKTRMENNQKKFGGYLRINPSVASVLFGMLVGPGLSDSSGGESGDSSGGSRFQSSARQLRAHRRAALSMNERGAALRLRHPLRNTETHRSMTRIGGSIGRDRGRGFMWSMKNLVEAHK